MSDPAEYLHTEKVQRDAWGIDKEESIIPFHILIAAQHHGGLVLGAYDGAQMVGCLFGISAYDEKLRRPYHYSHITAVLRAYQKLGVGFRLKKTQRNYLLKRKIDLVKWTFDPLQAGNAYFNIRKLGTIAREYHRNLYGTMPDALNRGMVSDRFEIEWWLNSRRVRETLQGKRRHLDPSELASQGVRLINETKEQRGFRVPVRANLGHNDSVLLFEIPFNIGKVKEEDLSMARNWTMQARKSFEHYFREGYAVTDVLVARETRENRVYYLLEADRTVLG